MQKVKQVLGIDSSTQSISAVVMDIDSYEVAKEYSVRYMSDPRLAHYNLDPQTVTVPSKEEGQANQPPLLFLESLELLFSDLREQGLDFDTIEAINISAQQHGHVYLAKESERAFQTLSQNNSGKTEEDLSEIFRQAFSYPEAPIWMTSNTVEEADDLRSIAGGIREMIDRTGSNSPLRFTGAVISHISRKYPDKYRETESILLINSFLSAVLSGNSKVQMDFANGSGTSLMNYGKRIWDPRLLSGIDDKSTVPGSVLSQKLPNICHPQDSMGEIASYFIDKFGFNPKCKILAGSGDNPQSKVLVKGDLLSLGTSIVFMTETDSEARDYNGWANSMYDGLGNPFMFGCRTNGALVWDSVREKYGVDPKDYTKAEQALEKSPAGNCIRIWQPNNESFPLSASFGLTRDDSFPEDFESDYSGIIDSTLGLIWYYSNSFAGNTDPDSPIYVTGGPSASPAICKRIASMWNRSVCVIGSAGAAKGAALAALLSMKPGNEEGEVRKYLEKDNIFYEPETESTRKYHDDYMPRLIKLFEEVSGSKHKG